MSLNVVKSSGTKCAEPKSPISKFSRKAFFSYAPDENSFQQGYLGASKSFLSGILHIRYTDDKPIFAKKVKVTFVGKEYVFFRGTLDEGQSDHEDGIYYDRDGDGCDNDDGNLPTSSTKISVHTAKRKIFGTSACLWRSQSKGSYEGIKSLDLPFKFHLPDDLPPSVIMNKGCGRIYYILKAEISRRPLDPDSRDFKKMIKLVVPIHRYTITPQPNPLKWFINEEGPVTSHIVGYEVLTSHATYGPGGTLKVPVKLNFREPQVYLKKIIVGIKEYHELRTNQYETTTKRYLTREVITSDSIPITSEPDNLISVVVNLTIPHHRNLNYSFETTYLTVLHKLKVKIDLGGAPNIRLTRPVTIENVVTREEVFPPPPPPQPIKVDAPVVKQRKTIIAPIEPTKLSNKKGRQMSFLPFFSKIRALDFVTQKRISMLQLQIVDSKNPHVIYNSRSLVVS